MSDLATLAPKSSEKSRREADGLSLLEQVAVGSEATTTSTATTQKTPLQRIRSMKQKRCKNPKAPIIFGISKTDGMALVHKSKCNMWNCETCKARKAQRAVAYLLNHVNTVGGQWYFVTITPHANAVKDGWSLANLRKNWHKLRKRMRAKHGGKFDYFRVWETFKNGEWHMHMVTNCELPYEWGRRPDGKMGWKSAWLKKNAAESGLGWVCDYQPLENAGFAAHYVAKYLTKALDDGVQWEKHQHRYRTSDDWTPLEDWSEEGDFEWQYIKDASELYKTAKAVEQTGIEIYISSSPQKKRNVTELIHWWQRVRSANPNLSEWWAYAEVKWHERTQ